MNDLIALLFLVVIVGAIGMAVMVAFEFIVIAAVVIFLLLLPSMIGGFIDEWRNPR